MRTQKAELTILDGNHANQVLSLDQIAGEVDVSSFTIQNGDTVPRGGGLSINSTASDNSRPVVVGNIIRNNHTISDAGGVHIYSGTANMFF